MVTLLQLYSDGKSNAMEQEELMEFIRSAEYDHLVENYMDESWKINEVEVALTQHQSETILGNILGGGKRVSIKPRSRAMYRWMAAASILILVSSLVILNLSKNRQPATEPPLAQTKDIEAPKETRAIITLADGRKIYLDSAHNGILAQQNNVNVVRNEKGEIEYQSLSTNHSPLTYNTLYNPRGSKVISLTLNDGTKVWLNSESSLKYPTAFNANTREVEITGEAYFEVTRSVIASGAKQSFIVRKGDLSVTVLGTHFNVNAYDDEDASRVTLIEGSVRVSSSQRAERRSNLPKTEIVLKPGQQVSAVDGQLSIVVSPDLDGVMAWKEGFFQFDHTDTKTMLRQLARWYDVEVRYEGPIPTRRFGGRINRQLSLSEVLNMLKSSGVNFRIEGKTIMVLK